MDVGHPVPDEVGDDSVDHFRLDGLAGGFWHCNRASIVKHCFKYRKADCGIRPPFWGGEPFFRLKWIPSPRYSDR